MSKQIPLIIVNPKSGRGLTERSWASIGGTLHKHLGAFDFEFTKSGGDAISIAQREARKGRKLIIAFGGDGTISEVANGILKSGHSTELGILPQGTGGDFARGLAFPNVLWQAARRLAKAEPRKADAGKIKFRAWDGKEVTRYFVNVSSFGMSGKVAGRTNRSSKRLGGKVTFAAVTLKTMLQHSPHDIVLKLDSEMPQRMRIATVCVANGRYFGGGMRIAPSALIDDGQLDVVIIGDFSTSEMLLSAHRLYWGTHLNLKKVAFARVQKLEAHPADPSDEIPLEVDGETPGCLPASYEILPGVLTLRC
jgi:diacylglycerol kinase (ATP)